MEAGKAEQGERLNKYLSAAGVCSRREADRRIEAGEVTIDGHVAVMGEKVLPGQTVCVGGKPVVPVSQSVILLVNKPKGIVCTAEKREKNNIIDFLHYPIRVYPVGRLDKDSRGLILMTNEGDIVNRIMRAGNRHEKEYEVTVDKPITGDFLQKMAQGVYLPELDTTTRQCRVTKRGARKFTIILTQGLNRQIRRMCEALGYHVRDLKRVRIMNLYLGDLPEGKYRGITADERAELMELIRDSPSVSRYASKNGTLP